jgi:hypothetical protein
MAGKTGALFFVTEAWAAKTDVKAGEDLPLLETPVRDMPNAQDALIGVLYAPMTEIMFVSFVENGIPGSPEVTETATFPNGNLTNPFQPLRPMAEA